MRILHTSDWHAGRIWKGVDRLSELANVLAYLGDFVEREKVDLVLMSGDVFDNGAPKAESEKLVFGFFKRIGLGGAKSVVIAGNHDNPARLQAWGTLAELVDVHAVGVPKRASEGGLVDLEMRSGERARIAAVPFAPVHRMVSALDIAHQETRAKQTYDEMMRRIIQHLSEGFDVDAVNLLVAHSHIQGARFSGSEREVHLGEQWATTPQAFPPTAHYVALGHIHRPQRVEAAPSPTFYAGSPVQLDFGEENETKSFVLVEARYREPARISQVDYEGNVPLRTVRAGLEVLDRDREALAKAGWLRVQVPLSSPDPDINGKVRRLLPNAVVVEAQIPAKKDDREGRPRAPRGAPPRELYRAYSMTQHGAEPEAYLLETFDHLLAEPDREPSNG